MYGLLVEGDAGNVIFGDGRPVLTQKWKGPIIVTEVPPQFMHPDTGVRYSVGYGYSTIAYPHPITTTAPPMVFGVPTASAGDKGLGLFCHRGQPGAWTGFSVLVTCKLFATSAQSSVGFDSGWSYRVCVFGDPGVRRSGASSYGIETISEDGSETTFHSDWPFVPFRNLLDHWQIVGYTRSYDFYRYFGNPASSGSVDNVLVTGTHTWGEADGNLGVLISSLGVIPLRHDIGVDYITSPGVVTIGFSGSDRANIWSVVFEGRSQHPAGNVSAMDQWRLLTADFSYV